EVRPGQPHTTQVGAVLPPAQWLANPGNWPTAGGVAHLFAPTVPALAGLEVEVVSGGLWIHAPGVGPANQPFASPVPDGPVIFARRGCPARGDQRGPRRPPRRLPRRDHGVHTGPRRRLVRTATGRTVRGEREHHATDRHGHGQRHVHRHPGQHGPRYG